MSDVDQSQRDWLVDQRYRAVLEVLGGSRVSEVALRYGVSRQAVYSWKAKYDAAGVDGAAGGVAATEDQPDPDLGRGRGLGL